MIEVFTTSIQNKIQTKKILKTFKSSFPQWKVNFDIDETKLPYPCGNSILRVEGKTINTEKVMLVLNKSGFKCDILEDKVCN